MCSIATPPNFTDPSLRPRRNRQIYASSSCSWGKSCAKRSNSRSMAPRFDERAREWNDGAWLGMFDGSVFRKPDNLRGCLMMCVLILFPRVGKAINQLSTNYIRFNWPITSHHTIVGYRLYPTIAWWDVIGQLNPIDLLGTHPEPAPKIPLLGDRWGQALINNQNKW